MMSTAETESVQSDPIVCSRCGSEIFAHHRFCGVCGSAIPTTGSADPPVVVRRRLGGTIWTPRSEAQDVSDQLALTTDPKAIEPSVHRKRRRKHRRARWYRRPVIVAPLVLLLIVSGLLGTFAYRAGSTLNTLHALPTLPAQITDSTQGDAIAAGRAFDTGPARQALEHAGIVTVAESNGLLGKVKAATTNAGGLAAGAAMAAGVNDPSTDAMTLLVMGVDARPGAPIDIGVRPDALMVLYLNPASGACRGLAIPRDALVELPGYGQTKINHALMVAGIRYQQLVVEQFLNIAIDHYALIDFVGFRELVDAVGGVTVTVPADLKDGETVLFAGGSQTFDGDQALAYARYRGAADGDVGRVRRQQQIIRGLAQVSSGRNLARDVNELLPALSAHVRTDLQPDELIALLDQYRSSCSDSQLELDTLQGDLYRPETLDPLYQQPLDYVRIDQAVIEQKVANLLRP